MGTGDAGGGEVRTPPNLPPPPLPSPPVPISPLAGGYRSGMNPEAHECFTVCSKKKSNILGGDTHPLALGCKFFFFLILTSFFFFFTLMVREVQKNHLFIFLFFWPVSPHLSSTACMLRLMRAVSGSHQRKAEPSPAPQLL